MAKKRKSAQQQTSSKQPESPSSEKTSFRKELIIALIGAITTICAALIGISTNWGKDNNLTILDFVIKNEQFPPGVYEQNPTCEVFSYVENHYCGMTGNPVISSKPEVISCFFSKEEGQELPLMQYPKSALYGSYVQYGEGDHSDWVAETAQLYGFEFDNAITAKLSAALWNRYLEDDSPENPHLVLQRGRNVLILKGQPSNKKSSLCFELLRTMLINVESKESDK